MASSRQTITVNKFVSSPDELLSVEPPISNKLNMAVYLRDCHNVISGLLDRSRIRNPNSYNRLTKIPPKKDLEKLRDKWDILFGQYYSIYNSNPAVITKTIQISLNTLLWTTLCKLNELIRRVGGFNFQAATDFAYVRLYELCVSDQNIGAYKLSTWIEAKDVLLKRMKTLEFSSQFISYLRQLIMRISVLVAKAHSSDVMDVASLCCRVSEPGCKGGALYSFKPFAIAELCQWYYTMKCLLRHYTWFPRVSSDSYDISDALVSRTRKLLGEQAAGIRMASKFVQKFKKKLILPLCLLPGEKERFIREKGAVNNEAEILMYCRAPGFVDYLNVKYFKERTLEQMITEPALTSPGMYKQRRFGWIENLLTLKIINLLFQKHRSRFTWQSLCVLLEKDFEEHIEKERMRKHPCIVQNFNGFDVVHKSTYINTRCPIKALLVWCRIVLTESDGRLYENYNVKDLLQTFLEVSSGDNQSESSAMSEDDEDYYSENEHTFQQQLSEEFKSILDVVSRKRKTIQ